MGMKRLGGNAGELRAELRSVVRVFEACRRTNDLKALGGNIQPVPQAPQQEADFRARRASVEMRFVKDDEKLLAVDCCSSHSRVLSKMGRSIGRMSMYSSIE